MTQQQFQELKSGNAERMDRLERSFDRFEANFGRL